MRAVDGAAAGARVRLFTRRGFDWSERFPAILEAAGALPVASASLDAEAVVCGDDGIAEFDKLHSRRWDHAVILYAFDLIEINGDDLGNCGSNSARCNWTDCWRARRRAFASTNTAPTSTAPPCSRPRARGVVRA